jgi:hypothetical protein
MTRYQKVWTVGFLSIASAIIFMLIYSRLTSDDWQDVQDKLNNLTAEQIDTIIIAPSNPKWKINLIIDTIYMTQKEDLISVVSIVKKINEKYGGRAAGGKWDANMTIVYNNGDRIVLKLRDSVDGFFIELTNVMGYQMYYCNDLKKYLENYTGYTQPVGGWHD